MLNTFLNHPFCIFFVLFGFILIWWSELLVDDLSNAPFKHIGEDNSFHSGMKIGFLAFTLCIGSIIVAIHVDEAIGKKVSTFNRYVKSGRASKAILKSALVSPFDELRFSLAQNKETSPEYLKVLLNDPSPMVREKARANLQIQKQIDFNPYLFEQSALDQISFFMIILFCVALIFLMKSRGIVRYLYGSAALALIMFSYYSAEANFIKSANQVYVVSSLLDNNPSSDKVYEWINEFSTIYSQNNNLLSVFARKSDKLDNKNLKLLLTKNLNSIDRSIVFGELVKRKEIVLQEPEVSENFKEDLNFNSL